MNITLTSVESSTVLTKDLLNYRTRSGKAYPQFVDPRDSDLLAMSTELIQIFQSADGKSLAEVEAELDESSWSSHPARPALAKLLFDRCDEAEDDGKIEEQRWLQLKAAQDLREANDFASLEAYQKALAAHFNQSLTDLSEALYSDLPEFRRIKNFVTLAPEALLHRLNCAQVQGLLIYALDVKVKIAASLAERRRFFRNLKFQRLLSTITETDGGFEIALSGPLRIFQNTQSYGLRLANFFPYILQMPKWELEAELKINNKQLSLILDHKIRIQSHYRDSTPFIPKELTAFISSFNERSDEWQAAMGTEFVNLGQQSYCFPDVTLTSKHGQVVHLELFHRWHSGQLSSRLKALEGSIAQPLILGVSQELRSDKTVDAMLSCSPWFNQHGFSFKNFPTPKTVLSALTKCSQSVALSGNN